MDRTFSSPGRGLRRWTATAMLIALLGSLLGPDAIMAQTGYTYLPTANTKDAHFLSIAGSGFQTLTGTITLKIASPSSAASVEIGIFDGETSGMWDFGNIPLTYTLCADPLGDGSGTVKIAQWNGNTMPDNAWFTRVIANTSPARGASGDYFYTLKVTSPSPMAYYLSVFKVRTTGTVAIMADQMFSYIAPINSLADAQVIYPNYPATTPTTYNGAWNFFLDVTGPQGSIEIWDGDMDFGKYDCSENDLDDPDTPNQIPVWAQRTSAVPEGVAGGGVPCMNSAGVVTGGVTTSNPPDDSYRSTSKREPSVMYQLVDPNDVVYQNSNPSGNVEWERFVVDTAPFNRSRMDLHAAALPGGIYDVRIVGVDMSNLNAFRFPFDAVGVDSNGVPVTPLRPYTVHGVVFYDANGNGIQESGENGLAGVEVSISSGGTDVTDNAGKYAFSVVPGTYTVVVDPSSLSDDLVPASDFDGIATPHRAVVTVGPGRPDQNVFFGYKSVAVPGNANGTRTRGYWKNHTENWPLSFITLGCVTYSKAEAIEILKRPTRGDVTYSMAAQLIATKLNIAAGTDASCIASTVSAADSWLCQYPVGSGGKPGWKVGEPIHDKLDDYNNGRLCVPHMQ